MSVQQSDKAAIFVVEEEDADDDGDSPSLSTKKIGAEPASQRAPVFRKANMLHRENTKSLIKELSLKGGGTLTKSEDRAVGKVKKSVYGTYLKNWGPGLILPLLLLLNKSTESGLTV